LQQDFPGILFVPQPFCRSFTASDFHKRTLRAAADFKRDGGNLGRFEMKRGVVIRKRGQQASDFALGGSEAVPPISITVVDHGASAKNLLHTRAILAGHAHDHISKLGKSKRLLHDRTHGHVASVLFREAYRDGFRESHAE